MGMPEVIVDGEVIEADPPRKLVQTWRLVTSPEIMAEGFTKLTYEIFETKGRGHPAHGHPRRDQRPGDRTHDRGHRRGRDQRGRRLGLDPLRPQVAAGNRLQHRQLTRG